MYQQKPIFAGRMLCMLVLFLSVILIRPLCTAADETDFYHEGLKFDSNGNLLMTTRDKKASSSVRYKTIGWIVKKTPHAVGSAQTVRLKLEQNGASRVDPTDPDYVFTYFKCEKSVIFAKIGAASEEWQKELYLNGGTVYLDAIMTVVEDGRVLGSMDELGVLRGEVYTTAAGIMNARNWADAQTLRTHYNKAVSFPPMPEFMIPEDGWEEEEKLRISYGEKECREYNSVWIRAAEKEEPVFDVTKGIPTGEKTYVSGQLQKYYYDGTLKRHYGMASVPVELHVTYTYQLETENGTEERSFTTTVKFYVNRPYSYYRIHKLKVYGVDHISVENESIPIFPWEKDNFNQPNIILEQNRNSYLIIPEFQAAVYGGDLTTGNCISMEELQNIAEAIAGNVLVRNDAFTVDGETVLDGNYFERTAPEPVQLSGARLQEFSGDLMTIPHTKRNDTYETYAVAAYREILQGGRKNKTVKHTNPVVVHTPVVCKGGITDDIAHNQQITPTQNFSLVLGRNFTVGISTFGTHKDQPGYQTRDYSKYTQLRQICFPFEVYDGTVHYEKQTWIDLPTEQKTFYLPIGVHEGDYRIRYRTIAKNADAFRGGMDQNGYLANMELSQYGAYDELTVTVLGRLYDLAVTDIVDYPRWRSVFYEPQGEKKNFAFWVGKRSLEGTDFSIRQSHGILPILAGDHPFQRSSRAVGLGYRVKIQLKTIGDMRGTEDFIGLIPSYYYLSRDGKIRQQVRLYEKKDLTEVDQPLILNASHRSFVSVRERNVSDPLLCDTSVQVWEGAYQLSPDLCLVDANVDLDHYIRQRGGRISPKDPVFLRDGYLLVQFEVRSYTKDLARFSYSNKKNDGRGYCNMWRTQGFVYDRVDVLGNQFTFTDGDCLLFDTKYSLHSDYESWGTH